MKSNRANSSSNFKKLSENPNHNTDYFNSYVKSHFIKTKPLSKYIKHYNPDSSAKNMLSAQKINRKKRM